MLIAKCFYRLTTFFPLINQIKLFLFSSFDYLLSVYFVHSYYVEPHDQQGVAAVTDYGSPYCSVIATEQVWGTQFHPEKSGTVGLRLLKNFVRWANG